MRFLTVLLLILALSILALFLKPILQPETVRGPKPEGFSTSRVQAVTSKGSIPAPSKDESPEKKADPVGDPVPSGPLCDREFDASSATVLPIPGGRTIRTGPATPGTPWTWVNVWAVWCKPCKAEMPLLSSWANTVRGRGGALRVMFLSVDDDERQLSRFMKARGAGLVGEFLWVEEETARTRFYRALNTGDSPTLPVHALLDPEGRLRCVRVGSVEGRDLEEAARRFRF